MTHSVRGVWPPSQRHINLLEMETVLRVLHHFVPMLEGRDVLIKSDRGGSINRQGGVRSLALHRLATAL